MKPLLAGVLAIFMTTAAWASERATQAWTMIEQGAIIIDVRTPQEYAEGNLPGSVNLPLDQFEQEFQALVADKSQPVVLYCRSGRRSGVALDMMQDAGYDKAHNGGGLSEMQQSQ